MYKKKMKAGGGFTYGAGDGDMTPQKSGMEMMAKGGGLKGFMKGGNKGDMRRSAKRDY